MRSERAAIRASLAVVLAVSLYGVSFGALAVASGLDVWQTCVLSLFMFSGGSQFALIGVLASGGSSAGFAAVVGAALLGTRNGLYAIRMSPIVVAVGAATVAAVLTPALPAGVPILLAASVAVVVGLFNWFGRREAA